ncbi:hypothetical protein Tco_0642950 [Tanacetum coccineum]
MHTRASNSELVKPLSELERTLNRRLRRRNRRVPFERRDERPSQPRIIYLPILDIKYFCHFLDIFENYNPMDDEPMWVADHVVALTPGFAITIPETTNEFAIKGNHLTLVKGNQFDGRIKTDLQKHIHEFLEICDMFKYKDTENEAVRLMMFPLSLTGEAKTANYNELNEGTLKTLDELVTTSSISVTAHVFSNDVINEIFEEDFDALLDERSEMPSFHRGIDIATKDEKGIENVAADHLSQIDNDEVSNDSDIDDNFPGEILMEITTKDIPCSHIEGNVQLKFGGEPNRKN